MNCWKYRFTRLLRKNELVGEFFDIANKFYAISDFSTLQPLQTSSSDSNVVHVPDEYKNLECNYFTDNKDELIRTDRKPDTAINKKNEEDIQSNDIICSDYDRFECTHIERDLQGDRNGSPKTRPIALSLILNWLDYIRKLPCDMLYNWMPLKGRKWSLYIQSYALIALNHVTFTPSKVLQFTLGITQTGKATNQGHDFDPLKRYLFLCVQYAKFVLTKGIRQADELSQFNLQKCTPYMEEIAYKIVNKEIHFDDDMQYEDILKQKVPLTERERQRRDSYPTTEWNKCDDIRYRLLAASPLPTFSFQGSKKHAGASDELFKVFFYEREKTVTFLAWTDAPPAKSGEGGGDCRGVIEFGRVVDSYGNVLDLSKTDEREVRRESTNKIEFDGKRTEMLLKDAETIKDMRTEEKQEAAKTYNDLESGGLNFDALKAAREAIELYTNDVNVFPNERAAEEAVQKALEEANKVEGEEKVKFQEAAIAADKFLQSEISLKIVTKSYEKASAAAEMTKDYIKINAGTVLTFYDEGRQRLIITNHDTFWAHSNGKQAPPTTIPSRINTLMNVLGARGATRIDKASHVLHGRRAWEGCWDKNIREILSQGPMLEFSGKKTGTSSLSRERDRKFEVYDYKGKSYLWWGDDATRQCLGFMEIKSVRDATSKLDVNLSEYSKAKKDDRYIQPAQIEFVGVDESTQPVKVKNPELWFPFFAIVVGEGATNTDALNNLPTRDDNITYDVTVTYASGDPPKTETIPNVSTIRKQGNQLILHNGERIEVTLPSSTSKSPSVEDAHTDTEVEKLVDGGDGGAPPASVSGTVSGMASRATQVMGKDLDGDYKYFDIQSLLNKRDFLTENGTEVVLKDDRNAYLIQNTDGTNVPTIASLQDALRPSDIPVTRPSSRSSFRKGREAARLQLRLLTRN